MINVDIKEGYLCADAQFFRTRSGRPKLTFRLGTPRDKSRPPKGAPPHNADFVSVVAYGDRLAPLLPELRARRHVLVVGFTQSRDLAGGNVITEVVAERITLFDDYRPTPDRKGEPDAEAGDYGYLDDDDEGEE